MTTFTTMLAMVPMGFFPGEGAELVQPIGQTVIGGLAASTLMTLFLIPVLYALFNRGHDNNRKGIVQSPAPSLIENLRQEEVHETA
jgi:HAE1 family hydrophobic/amphiphilic exporter-1